MSLLSFLAKIVASFTQQKIERWSHRPDETQGAVFKTLIHEGKKTTFGRAHGFSSITDYTSFKERVPIRTYEEFIPFIERIKSGEADVLWPGKPIYLCKTSGTTAGIKYIPITKESIHNHINSARNALLMYISGSGNSEFVNGKMIFFSGSPALEEIGGIPFGRLSGIVNHHVPSYLKRNQLPSYATNCIEDWETKVDAIVEETFTKDMRLISGIPPWVQMYFDKLQKKTGKKAGTLFPQFSLFVFGGVNFEPYRAALEESVGRKVDTLETYPSSEGFIAFQDRRDDKGLLLILNEGIFYEFIPAADYFSESRKRISLTNIELGVNYAIILNTNAGLWGYSIGDTVKFVSKNPYRLIVSGRIKHHLSAFGEHVIGEEVEGAIHYAASQSACRVRDFTVAPQVNPPEGGLPYHEWFIEFSDAPEKLDYFAEQLEAKMAEQNIYYRDLVYGNILRPLRIRVMRENAFLNYMKMEGKLGGQNKVPHLSNDRKMAEGLQAWIA